MPLYTVTQKGEEAPRLIEAASAAAALRYAAAPMFDIAIVSKMAALAKLLTAGVKLETAGDAPAQTVEAPAEPKPEPAAIKASDALLAAEAERATGGTLMERMAKVAKDAKPQPESTTTEGDE